MAIKREDIDNGLVDLSEVTVGRRLPPVHPGEILRDDFLAPLRLSVYRLARELKVPRSRLNDLVRCRRHDLDRHGTSSRPLFGTSPEFWINLQMRYDLDTATRTTHRQSRTRSGAARCMTPGSPSPG